jgi:hypothetical protein
MPFQTKRTGRLPAPIWSKHAGIEPAILDDLHAVGTIFANDHRPNPSIVFLHRSQHGKVEGATLRDTRHQSLFFPCLGNKLTAWFTVGHLDKAEIVIAVESPIDALSYRTIHACGGDAWAVVSCAERGFLTN